MFSARNVIILLIIAAVAGFAFLTLSRPNVSIVTPNPAPTKSSDITAIQSEGQEPEIKDIPEVYSPDGKMKLIMEKTTIEEGIDYSFLVSETDTGIREIYRKTVLPETNFELSPNAWSPDNKYFFITERVSDSVNYFVFRKDGEPFSESEEYISAVPLFVAKNTGYMFSEITGWDSETLIHVYTTTEDGSRGPSFWFEIPSKAIIRLASR